MNLKNALLVLRTLQSSLATHLPDFSLDKSVPLRCLYDFSHFYLAMHFPQQLRTSSREVLDSLSLAQIAEVIQHSVKHISGSDDDNRDINTLISFAKDVLGDGDLYGLLARLNQKVQACQAFDMQRTPEIRQFMALMD